MEANYNTILIQAIACVLIFAVAMGNLLNKFNNKEVKHGTKK
jgi:hypothetical protein